MSATDNIDGPPDDWRDSTKPYTGHRPIPTIKNYREEKERRKGVSDAQAEHAQDDGLQAIHEDRQDADTSSEEDEEDEDGSDVEEVMQDTSEAVNNTGDPKAKRKEMKKRKGDRAERLVTDPVTHLPLRIHDFTTEDLKRETSTKSFQQAEYQRRNKSENQEEHLRKDAATSQKTHAAMEKLFPPPDFQIVKMQFDRINLVSLAVTALTSAFLVHTFHLIHTRTISYDEDKSRKSPWLAHSVSLGIYTSSLVAVGTVAWLVQTWNSKKIDRIWQSGIWDAERKQGKKLAHQVAPESTHWLNSVLASIWPLMNPDLFISLSDTLEDVMQASLPRLVRMVSVEDIGQGSEAFRILGVKWLPRGAARKSVSKDGKLQKRSTDMSDRAVPGEGAVQGSDDGKDDNNDGTKDNQKEGGDDENMRQGLEAEEGDFINLQLAFAYKARLSTHGLRTRSNNPHLYLAFYLPGNIKLPVWVELRGFIGSLRMRLQLTPDPPFFSVCTLTFLGQPKVDLACVPLLKKGLNIMNLPLISNFVQSAVDAAMAEFVAPKSLTLDLKQMMVGDDFKKDTIARGIIVVHVKRAVDFKEGDAGFLFKEGSADGYVTVGWAKFGKPMWSSRVITGDMNPSWDETAYILVNPDELNVRERLRVQLWDSDRLTADDDLGRIEVDLAEIMQSEESKNKMSDRKDGFRSLKAGEGMPGTLEWSVGYFGKTELLEEQLDKNDKEIHSVEQLKRRTNRESERKLREASKDESDEIEQQKAQDFKEKQDELIIKGPPPSKYPSGIFSIVVHQIYDLELETLNKTTADDKESATDEQEEGEDLPSGYCDIIINHSKVYQTRTKPKNSRPFFNAGTERFLPDVRTAHVHVAVRDARVHEDDPIIGIVDLPLSEVFAERSQVHRVWPLAGGVGFGHIRISLVFRSIELQVPRSMLGWNYGTLEIDTDITGDVQSDLQGVKLKARSNLTSGKFRPKDGKWSAKHGKPIRLAVQKRYSAPVVLEFRTSALFGNSTSAFGILWLKDIPDDDEQTIDLPIWKGDLKRAEANILDEYGEKLGSLKIKLKFWHGLSGYHLGLAKNDSNVENVMEILDASADIEDDESPENKPDSDASSESDLDDAPTKQDATSKDEEGEKLATDGKRGTMDQIQDYKRHQKQLHRKNRGLMQWKIPRTVKWMKGKVERTGQKTKDMFGHHDGSAIVETEV